MNHSFHRTGQLLGKTILLVAEAPQDLLENEIEGRDDLPVRFEEAILSLVRAVLSENGQLVVNGDPDISLLAAAIASEYIKPLPAERRRFDESDDNRISTPLVIYLSERINEAFSSDIELIKETRYAEIRYSDSAEEVIKDVMPDTLICLGGRNEKPFRTIEALRQLRRHTPIYTIATTGGSANVLAREQREDIRVFDREFLQRLANIDRETQERGFSDNQDASSTPPYPVIMQEIVREIAQRD